MAFCSKFFVIIKVNGKYSRLAQVKNFGFSIPEHTAGSDFTISSTLLMSALLKMNNLCYNSKMKVSSRMIYRTEKL